MPRKVVPIRVPGGDESDVIFRTVEHAGCVAYPKEPEHRKPMRPMRPMRTGQNFTPPMNGFFFVCSTKTAYMQALYQQDQIFTTLYGDWTANTIPYDDLTPEQQQAFMEWVSKPTTIKIEQSTEAWLNEYIGMFPKTMTQAQMEDWVRGSLAILTLFTIGGPALKPLGIGIVNPAEANIFTGAVEAKYITNPLTGEIVSSTQANAIQALARSSSGLTQQQLVERMFSILSAP